MTEKQNNATWAKEQSKIRVLAIAKILDNGQRMAIDEIKRELVSKHGIQASYDTIRTDLDIIGLVLPLEVSTGRIGGYRRLDVECEEEPPSTEYPCAACTIAPDPENCIDKKCKQWRSWFMHRWEEMRNGTRTPTDW